MNPQHDGPDQILPADRHTTTDPGGRVLLRIPKSGKAIETHPPISIPGLMQTIAAKYPDRPALCYKTDGRWQTINYRDYLDRVRTCAKAFLHLGLERHHCVAILGFNSPEWFIADLAAIFAGGIAVGIYTTNSSEACHYCAESSRANIIVVQDDKQLQKILAIKDRLPHLKCIVQYEGEPKNGDVLSWERLFQIGREQPDDHLEKTLKQIAINECCTLVFTSGTVGNPKAVMLSHDNLLWNALGISERLRLKQGCEVLCSYLPLSHVAAQIVDIYTVLTIAGAIHFADKNALKGSLVDTLREVQPTCFLAVPRVWEKMFEKMTQVGAQNGRLKRAIANWAKGHALQHHLNKMNGIDTNTWSYSIASTFVFRRVKHALGLNRSLCNASAAAPLSTDVKRYFLSIDMPIMEAFGMSEVGGAHTICTEDAYGLETIGLPLLGAQTKIANPEDGQGELCLRGRHVFMGYMNEPEKTAETIDADGWLHTGDLGRIDGRGLVYITGRLKELLITAGGENVAPIPIEQAVKAELVHISNAFLIGDKRKFLSVLLSLKTKQDKEGRPLDELEPAVQVWLKELGCPAATVTDVFKAGPDPQLLDALQKGIDRANLQAVSNAQRIQKFAILPTDFSIPTGELGPTMKVKRNVVIKKYENLIETIYA